jgi:hypothetical protein
MKRASRALLLGVVITGQAHAQAPADLWATINTLRNRLVAIYSADREHCLHPTDTTKDYCGTAQSELASIRDLDRQIADAQRGTVRQ